MPTPKRGARLGGGPAHQKLMLSNLASDLFVHGRIRTTEAKAKTLRPYAEKLITKAKRGDLHARRQVLSDLRDRDVVAYLFEEVAPRFTERNGGYTRILKLGPRKGDNAKMALIELVERGFEGEGEDFVEESRTQRARGLFGRMRRRRDEDTGAGEWTVEDEVDPRADVAIEDEVGTDADELADAADAPEPSEDVSAALAEVADPDSDADSLADATGRAPADAAPDDDGGAPDVQDDTASTTPADPTVGAPTEERGDDQADAGEASGKDAGES